MRRKEVSEHHHDWRRSTRPVFSVEGVGIYAISKAINTRAQHGPETALAIHIERASHPFAKVTRTVTKPSNSAANHFADECKTRHQKWPSETGGRNDASMAEFRTRRPSHICETSRCRAVFERSSYVTRWRRTGWLGRRDSNLCISKSDLLNL
jgi:hypothetical protein